MHGVAPVKLCILDKELKDVDDVVHRVADQVPGAETEYLPWGPSAAQPRAPADAHDGAVERRQHRHPHAVLEEVRRADDAPRCRLRRRSLGARRHDEVRGVALALRPPAQPGGDGEVVAAAEVDRVAAEAGDVLGRLLPGQDGGLQKRGVELRPMGLGAYEARPSLSIAPRWATNRIHQCLSSAAAFRFDLPSPERTGPGESCPGTCA